MSAAAATSVCSFVTSGFWSLTSTSGALQSNTAGSPGQQAIYGDAVARPLTIPLTIGPVGGPLRAIAGARREPGESAATSGLGRDQARTRRAVTISPPSSTVRVGAGVPDAKRMRTDSAPTGWNARAPW